MTSGMLGIGTLALFAICHQERLHNEDSNTFLVLLQVGSLGGYDRHVAFLPLVNGVWQLLAPFGATAFQAMVFASALGTALGVVCLHRALRRLLPDGIGAVWPTIGTALTPAVSYFGTAAEIPGVFMAGVGAAWWAFAWWRDRGSPASAGLLGGVCAAAAAVHSLGALLLPMFVGMASVLDRRSLRVVGGHGCVAACGFVGVALAISWSLRGQAMAQAGDAWHFLSHWDVGAHLAQIPGRALHEWLVPYAPWAWLAPLGCCVARARPWVLAFGVALAVHFFAALLLLGPFAPAELGAYLLPVAPIAVVATSAWMPMRWFRVAVLGSAVCAVAFVGPQLRPAYAPDFIAGIEELRATQRFTLLAEWPEVEGVRKHVTAIACFEAEKLLEHFSVVREEEHQPTTLAQWFDACSGTVNAFGAPYLVTAGAAHRIAGSWREDVRALWTTHVPATYRLVPVECAGLRGTLLMPK